MFSLRLCVTSAIAILQKSKLAIGADLDIFGLLKGWLSHKRRRPLNMSLADLTGTLDC
jgi:hypothetical protein